MTLAEKLAALPPKSNEPTFEYGLPGVNPSAIIWTYNNPVTGLVSSQSPTPWREYAIDVRSHLNARLSLLLETVRAYTEASDFLNARVESDERAGAYHENKAEIEAVDMAYADLRTLQAHLEGERT